MPFSFPHVGWASRNLDPCKLDLSSSPRQRIVELYRSNKTSARQDGLYMVTRDKAHKQRYITIIDSYFPALGTKLQQSSQPPARSRRKSWHSEGAEANARAQPPKSLSPAHNAASLRANLQHARIIEREWCSAAQARRMHDDEAKAAGRIPASLAAPAVPAPAAPPDGKDVEQAASGNMDWETEGVSVDHLSEMEGAADTEGGEGGGGEAHSPPCSEMQAREDMWVAAGQVLNIAEQAAAESRLGQILARYCRRAHPARGDGEYQRQRSMVSLEEIRERLERNQRRRGLRMPAAAEGGSSFARDEDAEVAGRLSPLVEQSDGAGSGDEGDAKTAPGDELEAAAAGDTCDTASDADAAGAWDIGRTPSFWMEGAADGSGGAGREDLDLEDVLVEAGRVCGMGACTIRVRVAVLVGMPKGRRGSARPDKPASSRISSISNTSAAELGVRRWGPSGEWGTGTGTETTKSGGALSS